MANRPQRIDVDKIEVIAPNLKRNLSGVTATIARLVPIQAQHIGIVATGPGLPETVPRISLWRLPLMPRKTLRIWHARRNLEMALGLILQKVFRRRLKLVFTSASQREHTAYTKWLISKMDAVIATSGKTAEFLDRPAKIILHGISTDRFKPASNKDRLRKQLGLPAGLLVGCFGRIRHQKGTDVFVDAMIDLLPEHPAMSGIILGRAVKEHTGFLGDLKARIEIAGLSERILFLPEVPVDQVARWYQVLDLFVAPQRSEGFGLTPLEAMACGVPVIAGRVGAFEEQITDGTTGLIIQEGDVEQLSRAIKNLVIDPKRLTKMGAAARKSVEMNFRIEDEAAALVALYRQHLNPTVNGAP